MIKNPENSAEEIKETPAKEMDKEKAKAKEDGVKEKKSKSKKADKALEEKEKEIAELKDTHLRLLAEYDNFKKRTVKEKEAIYTDSNTNF